MDMSVSSPAPFSSAAQLSGGLPLIVDLDALVRCDLLAESFFATLGRDPAIIFGMARAALSGKAALKAFLYDRVELDPATLPYEAGVLALIQSARRDGRPVYIVSEHDGRLVGPIGYGESRPIAPNTNPDGSDNPEGRAKNRRTELNVQN